MKRTKLLIAGIAASSLTFSSCMNTNAYTGESQVSKTSAGAALGAATGAIAGALIGNNQPGGKSREYALKGAAIGALAGGGIGNYMDQQEAQIRQQLRGTGVSVTRQGNSIFLNMPSDITFNTGSARIEPQFEGTLKSVALVLKKYDKTGISVIGHTDNVGSDSSNKTLSEARAKSVANVLIYNGVHRNRTAIYGYGEASPIASNSTSSGRAQNRRVELQIIPEQGQF